MMRPVPHLAVIATLLLTGPAAGQIPEPRPEDLALVADLLAQRLDIEPERIVYVAPGDGPDGSGTRDDPRRDLIAVFEEAEAGTAIHLAPGVYDMSAIRDRFGHVDSTLWTSAGGEPGRPIVVRTDPELYEPGGATAVLDFGYENEALGARTSAVVVRHDFWVFERFEMRRVRDRGFWVSGYDNTFRELHLHHADTAGDNNQGLILMAASSRPTNNVILGCHLHTVGNIDRSTDTLLDRGSVNGGCFYTETRLTYDSAIPPAGHEASLAEWEARLLPPDSHVYLIGNRVHDCYYGLGLKNHSRGPYYFLGNLITDVEVGIFTPFTDNVIRNNIVVGADIWIGRSGGDDPSATFFKMTGNGARSEVSYNTVVGGRLSLQGGWASRLHHNLVVAGGPPVHVQRNQYYWYEGGAWPGIRGEYLIGDLDATHPFYHVMPGYMRELAYERLRLEDNCYDQEPAIAPADFTQPVADVTGMIFDVRYRVLSAAERAALFVDEAAGDYRLRDDVGLDCGARLGWGTPAPVADAGVPTPDAGVPMPDAGASPLDASAPRDGGASGADAGGPSAAPGCGCAVPAGSDESPLLLAALALLGLARRRGRRARAPADAVAPAGRE